MTITKNTTQDWNNYWQGRSAKDNGDALVGVGIESNKILETHWLKFFAECEEDDIIVDLACGAGSALKHAHAVGLPNLVGVDIAQDAVDIMQAKFPTAKGITANLDNLPLNSGEADVIVSQFGFEYAGKFENVLAAAAEVTRISSKKAKVALISHIEGGAIERGCLNSLEQIKTIEESGFLSVNETVFRALFQLLERQPRASQDDFNLALKPLNPAAEPIMTLLRSSQHQQNDFTRFVYHMMNSSHKLITRFERYELNDCLGWIKNTRHEIEAYKGRMESMSNAALSEENIKEVSDFFKKHGFEINTLDKLYFKANDSAAAWALIASR